MRTSRSRSAHRSWLLLIVAVVAPRMVLADEDALGEWRRTFSGPRAGAVVGADTKAALVLVAGRTALAEPAATALAEALRRERPEVALTPLPADLGAVDLLNDRQIVARVAEAEGFEEAVVVRVYPGSTLPAPAVEPGELAPPAPVGPEVALVTTYDRFGRSLGSVLATRGEVLALAHRERPAPSGSRDQRLLDRVAGLDETIHFQRTDKEKVGDARPYFHRPRVSLDGEGIYRVLGRADLAERYHKMQAARVTMIVQGPALAVGALITTFAGGLARQPQRCIVTAANGNCTQFGNAVSFESYVVAGAILMNLGAALFFTGISINPHPLSMDQLLPLVDEYNERMRRPPPSPASTLRVAPVVTPGRNGEGPSGGGVLVEGQF